MQVKDLAYHQATNSQFQKKDKPKPRGDATPDEGQEQAATEIAPIYVNPDGSIRYHAMLTATPNPETDTDDEKIED